VHIDELVAAFRQQGHDVRVVGPHVYTQTGFGGESALVATVRRLLPRALGELAELLYNISMFRRLHTAFADFSPDFVYERYSLYHLAGVLLKRFCRAPLYLEVNSPLVDERARFGGLALTRLARKLERRTWRSADRIFVVSGVLAQIVADAGVPRARITVVPNGVDRRAFPLSPHEPAAEGAVTIGFIGFMRDWHGLDAVLEGLAREPADPPIRLVIAGDGPARPALERQAEALGLGPRVQFIGIQQREDIPELIRQFDIALQPKAVSYASPLKLFEYMAAGRAIVAPNQPNIREILSDGETALLFDPDDPKAVWAAIRRLLVAPALREALGAAARQTLDARDYTWEGNAARVTGAVAIDAAQRPGYLAVASRLDPSGSQGTR
jgi:glycosyltransferase involved in cell wall biosynthesis